ncbi:MAG: hypothetical protein JWQ32_665 [Marmoricola sp.]|nr:hypothetical protein [Marmoricola sp.]
MEENTPENTPAETPAEITAERVAPTAPEVAAPVPARVPGPRLRDQVWSFRSLLAVGIASLLLGGAGGAGIVAATTGDGHGDRIARFAGGPDGRRGPGFGRFGGGYGFNGGPGGLNAPQNGQQNGPTGPGPVPATPSSPAG